IEYEFPSIINYISDLIREGEFWQDKSIIKTSSNQYFKYTFNGTTKPLTPSKDVIVEIAELQINYNQSCLLVECCLDKSQNVYVIKDLLPSHPKKAYWTQIEAVECTNELEFEKILLRNLPKKIHEHNPKHSQYAGLDNMDDLTFQKEIGDLKKLYLNNHVAPLLCNQKRAQDLLNSATYMGNELFAFDCKTDLFIEFKKTFPEKEVFHGYHRVDSESLFREYSSNIGKLNEIKEKAIEEENKKKTV
ncbi:MAG TPA: hypothetical protein PLG41_24235, partial [Leptospiraceae bacterium]|nr:hypothetical protein [Leptospiraceae bacterium]